MDQRFAKLPTWWVRRETNYFQSGKNAGQSIAGLKCLIALSLTMDFHTRKSDKSISALEDITGLSRPMVIKGTRHLESHGLVKVFRGDYANSYRVEESTDDAGWGKLPYTCMKRALPHIYNRGVVPLLALKTYVVLLARRPNQERVVSVPYEVILERTHGQRQHLRKALDILIAHGLVKCEKPVDFRAQNIYTIIGL